MGKGFSEINNFPTHFREKELVKIFGCIERSRCIQVIGPTGSGKSLILKAVTQSLKLREFYLKEESGNFIFSLVDLRFCIEKDIDSVITFLSSKITSAGLPKFEGKTSILELENLIARITSEGKHLVIIFDSFNEVNNPESLFEILKALYDQHRGNLSYIFAVNHEVDLNKNFNQFKNLTTILTENKLFIPPMKEKDFIWFISEMENYINCNLKLDEKKRIYELSGGYMATAKRIIEEINDGENLTTIENAPEKSDRLNYHFQTLLKDLVEEKETLNNIIKSQLSPLDDTAINYLKKTFILENENRFVIPLFKTYLENMNSRPEINPQEIIADKIILNSKLTSSEYKTLKYLCNNLAKFCTRDEIIEGVWGVKSEKGVSDHALDQIIYRLRKKLEKNDPQLKIETVWGRGHKAVLIS